MLQPFLILIDQVLNLYSIVLFIYIILQLLIQFNIVNYHQKLVQIIYDIGVALCEPLLKPIRGFMQRLLPLSMPIDFSPIILLLLLNFARNMMWAAYTQFA